jgi:hypothetical protein
MSFLRTNYRTTGKEIDIDAIGGGIVAGSWGGGAGTNRPFGGFIMGSFNGSIYATYHIVSAYGAMSEYFGSGQFDSGYKIFPIAIWDASVPVGATTSVNYKFLWSVSGSLFNVKIVKMSTWYDSAVNKYADSATTGLAATVTYSWREVSAMNHMAAVTSGETVHFVWAGFIVSGP